MRIELVVPVAPDGGRSAPLTDRSASLREKVIGLWYNNWSSYDVFVSTLDRLLNAEPTLSTKRIPNLPRHSMLTKTELDAIAGQIDTAIVGLGA